MKQTTCSNISLSRSSCSWEVRQIPESSTFAKSKMTCRRCLQGRQAAPLSSRPSWTGQVQWKACCATILSCTTARPSRQTPLTPGVSVITLCVAKGIPDISVALVSFPTHSRPLSLCPPLFLVMVSLLFSGGGGEGGIHLFELERSIQSLGKNLCVQPFPCTRMHTCAVSSAM